jgi:hypothetical protein
MWCCFAVLISFLNPNPNTNTRDACLLPTAEPVALFLCWVLVLSHKLQERQRQ